MHKLLLFITLLSTPLHADDGPGVLQIFDQFLVSNAAASQCAEVEPETLTKFMSNFRLMGVYAARELKKRYPERSKDEIESAIAKRMQVGSERLEAMIAERGCDDPQVQQVVKRFFVQAQWEPLKQ